MARNSIRLLCGLCAMLSMACRTTKEEALGGREFSEACVLDCTLQGEQEWVRRGSVELPFGRNVLTEGEAVSGLSYQDNAQVQAESSSRAARRGKVRLKVVRGLHEVGAPVSTVAAGP